MSTNLSNFRPSDSFVFDPSLTPTNPSTLAALAETNGKVVATFERTNDWSCFDDYRTFTELWLVVWDSVTKTATMKHVDSTENYGKTPTAFRPNASAEDKAAFWDWFNSTFKGEVAEKLANESIESRQRGIQKTLDEILNPSPKDFRRGDEVMVARGRKFPKGLKGKVFWVGENTKFGGWTLGVATSDRRDEKGRNADVAWIAAHNVDLIPAGERLTRKAELDAAMAETKTAAYKAGALADAAERILNVPGLVMTYLAARK